MRSWRCFDLVSTEQQSFVTYSATQWSAIYDTLLVSQFFVLASTHFNQFRRNTTVFADVHCIVQRNLLPGGNRFKPSGTMLCYALSTQLNFSQQCSLHRKAWYTLVFHCLCLLTNVHC